MYNGAVRVYSIILYIIIQIKKHWQVLNKTVSYKTLKRCTVTLYKK